MPLSAADMDDAAALLAAMSDRLKSMGSYEVGFTLSSGDYETRGSYSVSGDAYHISLNGVEVYCDGSVRREVYADRREVVVDRADTLSHNILDNPVRGLEFIADEYDCRILSDGDTTVIGLTPRRGGADGETIEVSLDRSRLLPVRIVYRLGSDEVDVAITAIGRIEGAVASFDASACEGYEIIDFR